MNSTTWPPGTRSGHDDARAALIVAEEVDVDGAAVLDQRDAHAPAVGQRDSPAATSRPAGSCRGRGARDLPRRGEPRPGSKSTCSWTS